MGRGFQFFDELLAGFLLQGTLDQRDCQCIKGQIGISVDTALRLAAYLGTTPNLWLNLQSNFDIRSISAEKKKELKNICCITAA